MIAIRNRDRSYSEYGISEAESKEIIKYIRSGNMTDEEEHLLLKSAIEANSSIFPDIYASIRSGISYENISKPDFYGYRRKAIAIFQNKRKENQEKKDDAQENEMNIKTLKQYRHMVLEIQDLEKRIYAHENNKNETRDSVRGGYGGQQRFNVQGQTDVKVSMEKSKYQMDILRKVQLANKVNEQKRAVEKYIDQIEDSRMRLIMRHRYIDGMNWENTAKAIGEPGQGDAVRVAADRFVRK